MKSEWREVRLGEVCDIRRGSSPRPIVDFILDAPPGMPWVKIADATKSNSRFIEKTNQFLKEEGVCKSVIVNSGDLILSNSGTAGLPKFMAITACIHDGWQVLRDLEGITSNYLYYTLLYTRALLLHNAYDSTMKNLTLDMVRDTTVLLPSISEQNAIANVLGTLDEKIELNRRMNVTLESMARALFKSWFVDFDPVIDNALAAGNPIPEPLSARAQTRRDLGTKRKPLPKNIQKLFPDAFVFDEEMGWIPDGWEVDSIKNRAAAIQYGFTQSSSEEKVGPHFLRITDIRGGKVNWPSVPFCVATESEKEKYRIQDGDIFVARTGASTGENTYVVEPPDAVFASYLVRFQFVSRGLGRFVGQFMRSPSFFNHVDGILGGSAQPNASAQALASAITAFPSDAIADVFFDELRSFDLKSSGNQRQASSLAKLRDTLLPKLLSGELRIPDAEKLLAGSL